VLSVAQCVWINFFQNFHVTASGPPTESQSRKFLILSSINRWPLNGGKICFKNFTGSRSFAASLLTGHPPFARQLLPYFKSRARTHIKWRGSIRLPSFHGEVSSKYACKGDSSAHYPDEYVCLGAEDEQDRAEKVDDQEKSGLDFHAG
jgi:hypothetical protein